MLRHISRGARRWGARVAVAAAVGLLATGCGSVTDSLLEVEDPDIINPSNLASPEGALALRNGAIQRFRLITAGAESTWLFGGLLADEWSTSSTFVQNDETDQRKIQTNNSSITTMYRQINHVRTATNQAVAGLRQYFPDSSTAIAEMYFARGFAEMQLAQDFCGAIPLSDAAGDALNLAAPSTTVQVFEKAVASYDSALTLVGTSTAAAPLRIQRAARIGKARALLGLGRFAEAGTTVPTSAVPTNFSYQHTFSLTTNTNTIWGQGLSSRRYSVSDSIEGRGRDILVQNGIPFFSIGAVNGTIRDPRLPTTFTISTNGRDTTRSQDGQTNSRTTTLYGQLTSIDVVNGIDARLIEAEAALQANNPQLMLQILNALRSSAQTIGSITVAANALPQLTLPATRAAQVNLLFREKALWTFSRGQRLGDMRRLIRQYERPAEQVFPVGTHFRGGEYGTDVNLPIPQQEDNNPNFDRSQCVRTRA